MNERIHSNEELKEILESMHRISRAFYHSVAKLQNHPFIEFTGLMNEYIKCCQMAFDKGIDFTQCNGHTGRRLPLPEYAKKYIHEKLECIFNGDIKLK